MIVGVNEIVGDSVMVAVLVWVSVGVSVLVAWMVGVIVLLRVSDGVTVLCWAVLVASALVCVNTGSESMVQDERKTRRRRKTGCLIMIVTILLYFLTVGLNLSELLT